MHVRTTILLLLLLAGTAFVAGLNEVRRAEARKFNAAKVELDSAWRRSVEDFWQNQGLPLRKLTEEFAGGATMLGAILDRDRKAIDEQWDGRALASFGANAIWIFQADGALFHARANTEEALLEMPLLPAEAVEKLLHAENTAPFYFPLPPGTPGRLRLLELRAAPVRPQWDRQHHETPAALLLAGRIVDDELLAGALPPGTGEAHFQPASAAAAAQASPGEMRNVLPPLRDWRSRELAQLVFTNRNPALAGLETQGYRIFVAVLLGALAMFVCLFLLLEQALVQPLRRVIRALHTEDLTWLEKLRAQKAEFGELARLIQAFFQQRAELVREMEERHATEKALRLSEEMLRHAQKMEAVGRLAGGVAHDFNNLLTAIIGYAELLKQRFAANPAGRQPAELIHEAGERAAGLTRQLLAFSRKQLLQPKVIDLHTIIANLHRLLQRIIGEHIEIVAEPLAVHSRIKADPGQIEQVIVNLGVNARDAMPRGGRLTIATRDFVFAEADAATGLAAGAYVALEVGDTGEGMDAETKARIFEPFFTTKGPGKGTGLGLATVYGVVKQSHGAIVVESERGQGSTFRILLPREDAPVEQVQTAAAPVQSASRGERILIVEDEQIVRELVCEVLGGHGYEILATDRGTEALRLLAERPARLDLLISDVVMPEMNGAEVARRVREACPEAHVLFVSGYSENDMADQGLETLDFQILQKPFTPEGLARKVREILDRR